jgi:hypothetical protein
MRWRAPNMLPPGKMKEWRYSGTGSSVCGLMNGDEFIAWCRERWPMETGPVPQGPVRKVQQANHPDTIGKSRVAKRKPKTEPAPDVV